MSLTVGGVFFAKGRPPAGWAEHYDDFDHAKRNAWKHTVGIAAMAGGGALVLGGLARYWWNSRRSGAPEPLSLSLIRAPDGGALVVGRTF